MARASRYTDTVSFSSRAQVSDGYGGKTRSAAVVALADYACNIWVPSLHKIALVRTEYGMTEDAYVVMLSGAYSALILSGYTFTWQSNIYVVRAAYAVRGASDVKVATQVIAERKTA